MAENDSTQEKTEEATPKRKEKAREEGQVPRSRELTTTAVLVIGTAGLWIFGGYMAAIMMKIMSLNFSLEREVLFDEAFMLTQLGISFADAMWMLLPLFALLALAAILGPIALGGWLFSSKAIMPKLNRMDPIAGLKRMFSMKSLMELFKAIGKVLVVMVVGYVVLKVFAREIMSLSELPIAQGLADSLELSALAALILACSTIVVAVIDVPFQIFDHAKKLRMSKQDVKDEHKDAEGKPEVKSRIRQLQREMAQRRMMEKVPEADVVITNPTHFSVALRYDPQTMDTPILVAKGVDHIALKIREIAKAHKVEFVQSPILARAVYYTTELENPIPGGLYVAVAQVLAYVFQLRDFRRGRGEKPAYPRNIQVPRDLHYDANGKQN